MTFCIKAGSDESHKYHYVIVAGLFGADDTCHHFPTDVRRTEAGTACRQADHEEAAVIQFSSRSFADLGTPVHAQELGGGCIGRVGMQP